MKPIPTTCALLLVACVFQAGATSHIATAVPPKSQNQRNIRYRIHLTDGTFVDADRYLDGTKYFWLTNPDHGETRLPKSSVKKIEEIAAEKAVFTKKPEKLEPLNALPGIASVASIIDGDTVKLDTGDVVRLIGIDTPETKHPKKAVQRFGREATAFTQKHLEGERIRLTYDQANAATQHRDRYGRILAYAVRDRDGLDFNAEIIKQGFANAYAKYPLERNDEFLEYQREARENELGLWSNETTTRGPPTARTAYRTQARKSPSYSRPQGEAAENGSYQGEVSSYTGRPKTTYVRGYYRKDGTYVRSHYRSR